jgi:tetratricopeptide (TPR) repeat protein
LQGLWRIWFELGATQQYYPLLHSAFWLEHRIWGDAVLGYHLVNVALHAISAYLVVLIVRRLALPGAWLAGLIFALHPVFVEGVAWISEQKSTLSGAFCLTAALVYLNFDRTRRRQQYFLALGLFVLALLSKTVTATLPAGLLVVFWWQRGRLEWRRDILPLLPWLVVGASAGLFTAWVESAPEFIGAHGPEYELSLPQRLLLAGRVPLFYAWKLMWPSNLIFLYPRWTIDPSEWWQYLFPLATVALAGVLVFLARKNRGPLAGFLFFTGTLFPALGFLNVYPFRYSYVADHFQYLAALGLIVPAAAWLTALAGRLSPSKTAAVALSALLLAILGGLSWRQSGLYRDYETLFRETLARNPDSALAHNNLGTLLMQKPGGIPEALAEFEAAVRLKPDYPDYRVNLGLALSHTPGRLADAIKQYETALLSDPNYYAAHLNLGLALTQVPGRLPDAIASQKKAIELSRKALQGQPGSWQAHLNLGIAYAQMPDRQADAIAEYLTALRINPKSALAHFHLGNSYHKLGRLPEAVEEYRASLSIDPDFLEAHYELAYALAQIPGRVPEAIAACQSMLHLDPGNEAGQKLMASLLQFQNAQR